MSELHPGTPRDSFFSRSSYPEFDIYPRSAEASRPRLDSSSTGSSVSGSFGIFEPSAGAMAQDSMCVDEGAQPPAAGHGPQCQSLPQLSVLRGENGTSSLWARCGDCGAFSKVETNDGPVREQFSYSP